MSSISRTHVDQYYCSGRKQFPYHPFRAPYRGSRNLKKISRDVLAISMNSLAGSARYILCVSEESSPLNYIYGVV